MEWGTNLDSVTIHLMKRQIESSPFLATLVCSLLGDDFADTVSSQESKKCYLLQFDSVAVWFLLISDV